MVSACPRPVLASLLLHLAFTYLWLGMASTNSRSSYFECSASVFRLFVAGADLARCWCLWCFWRSDVALSSPRWAKLLFTRRCDIFLKYSARIFMDSMLSARNRLSPGERRVPLTRHIVASKECSGCGQNGKQIAHYIPNIAC